MRKRALSALFAPLLTLAGCGADFWPFKGTFDGERPRDGTARPEAADAPWSIPDIIRHIPHADVQPALPPPVAALKDGEFVDASGAVIPMHGFSYFGFNVPPNGSPHGLWQNEPVASDFANVVWRQKMLGFNAVRLPFSFSLFSQAPKNFVFDCTLPDAQAMGAATRDPTAQGSGAPPPLLREAERAAGKCNDYLPSETVREQFLWAVKFYVDNGFYVLIDNHLLEDPTAVDNFQAWVEGWKEVAHDLDAYEPAHGRVLFDILNEPGFKALNWDKVGPMYLTAMDALWEISQKFPFVVEGTGQEGIGANWGDGFCADPAKLTQGGLSDPRPFFNTLAGKPYAGWVALGPHVYGPAVTHAPDRFSGGPLWDRLDASWGLQRVAGIPTSSASPLKLPVLIGEFGSKFEDAGDRDFMRDFASYLNKADGAAGRAIKPVQNWFYWDWNADSGDTGGLVADDWKTIQWPKIRYLQGLGLKPWYAGDGATPHAVAAPPPAPTPAPAPAAPKPEAGPSKPPAPASAGFVTPPASPSAHPVGEDGDCGVVVKHDASWESGQMPYSTINLFFSALDQGETPVPFTVEAHHDDYAELVQSWNMEDVKLEGGTITGTVRAPWAALKAHEANVVNVGFVVGGHSDHLTPERVTINGGNCAVKKN